MNNIQHNQQEKRKCFKCGKVGHLKAARPNSNKDCSKGGDANILLAFEDSSLRKGPGSMTAVRVVTW